MRSRMQRYFSLHENVRKAYSELTPGEKTDFVSSAHDLMGDNLSKSLEITIDLSQSRTRRKQEVLEGAYHPESYFKEKYRDRPDLLQNVIENAPQVVHPDTKQTLWRDTKVTSSDSTVHEERNVHKMECTHESKVRVRKQPKRKAENGGVEDGSTPEKKLKPADKTKLETQLKALYDKNFEMNVLLKNRRAEVDLKVAPLIVKKLQASHAKSEETYASLQLTLNQDSHSDDVMSEINTAKEVAKESDLLIKAAKQQLEQVSPKPKDKSKAKGKPKPKERAPDVD